MFTSGEIKNVQSHGIKDAQVRFLLLSCGRVVIFGKEIDISN
jgi:hypothetical protein